MSTVNVTAYSDKTPYGIAYDILIPCDKSASSNINKQKHQHACVFFHG